MALDKAWPVFLVGSERSGTTLLRLMLDHHNHLAWCMEFEFVVDQLGPDGTAPNHHTYLDWLSTNRVFEATGFKADSTLSYGELVQSFLDQKQTASGKPFVGATVHRRFAMLRKLWPECRFIYIYRDGRDVARSIVTMGWAGHLWRAARMWLRAEQAWARLRQELSNADWIEVRYEDLIQAPEVELTRICNFLGVTYDPAMLRYPDHSSYKAPDASLSAQWRRKLSSADLGFIEAEVADQLTARGYELSGAKPIPVGPCRQRYIALQNLIGRHRWRFHRYGIGLSLAETISKRTGPKSWRKRCKQRVNEIDDQHLQ